LANFYSEMVGVPEYLLGTTEKNKTAITRGIVSVTRSPNETEGKLFSGGDEALMFAPMKKCNEWSSYCNELSELKCMIADLKWAYIHEGTLSEHNYMMRVAYDFNPLMYKFINKWGKDMVPIDLRVAINDIEINLFDTEHVTDWPKLALHEETMLPHNNTPYKQINRTM
jgi:hypothetical protein